MPVVDIGIVRMAVSDRRMPMGMRVRLTGRVVRTMGVPMVNVVGVAMAVCFVLVGMLVPVSLSQVEPDAYCHQPARGQHDPSDRLMPEQYGQDGTDEGRGGEVGAGAGRTETTEGQHEQHEAQPIAKETQYQGGRHLWDTGECAREQKANR